MYVVSQFLLVVQWLLFTRLVALAVGEEIGMTSAALSHAYFGSLSQLYHLSFVISIRGSTLCKVEINGKLFREGVVLWTSFPSRRFKGK